MLRPKLLAATRNQGKIREFRSLLDDLSFDLCGLAELGITDEVDETGATFIANAELKASAYARLSGLTTLADDSGLVVDALGGAPGVFSARYAGENATDAERIAKLLSALADIDSSRRSARFVCAISVADRTGSVVHAVEGRCEGRIAFEPRGLRGFGYDPIFVPAGFDASFGELTDDIKSQLSHRAVATLAVKRFLRDYFGSPT
jgi:XTP/dITP diphosphohydrolase